MTQNPMNDYAICVNNQGYGAALELRKVYRVMLDEDATRHKQIRVVDESGEDYLYPQSFFVPQRLPKAEQKVFILSA